MSNKKDPTKLPDGGVTRRGFLSSVGAGAVVVVMLLAAESESGWIVSSVGLALSALAFYSMYSEPFALGVTELDLPGPVQLKHQPPTHHVAWLTIGLHPIPGFAKLLRQSAAT